MEWAETLNSLSVHTLLIVAGILFLIMSVADKVSECSLRLRPANRPREALRAAW